MVSGSLALLYFLLGFHGRSPVERGDFPSVRPFVRLSVPPLWAIQPGLRPSQLGLRPSQSGLRPSQSGLRPSQSSLKPEAWLAVWAWDMAGLASGLAG